MKLHKIIPARGNKKQKKNIARHMRDLFQPDWYTRRYPAAADSGLVPFEHYLTHGEAEGNWPNPYFDPVYYRKNAPGAQKGTTTALEHYVSKGWKRDRNPSRNFSRKLYHRAYPEVAAQDLEPLRYHLQVGRYKGNIAFPLALEKSAEAHFVDQMQTIHASGLFDADWYGRNYCDLWHIHTDPLYHYVKTGWKQKRKPNIIFDPEWYSSAYAAEVEDQNPLLFYIEKGFNLGHNPSATFCSEKYLQENRNRMDKDAEPLAHYLTAGIAQGIKPPVPRIKGDTKAEPRAEIPLPATLRSVSDYTPVDLQPSKSSFDPEHMVLHWVVPSFSAGAGGHMTIFRMLHFLELAGHKQTLWINNPNPGDEPDKIYHMLENHFQHFTGDIKFVDETLPDAEGDAIIATDCWTVYPVLACPNFQRRFYFVQDFEPSFHPMGANYLLADQTYHEDLDCLCASPWLAGLMSEKYGRWARYFWLAADGRVYHPPKQPITTEKPRIAVYARHFTARRAVELAFLALENLATQGVDFVVDFFGASLPFKQAPFDFIDHGVASQEDLAGIFQRAALGLVFSATNYSLVPQEMMASGLPIVELDVESTRAIFPPEVITLAKPHPVAIANAIKTLLDDRSARAAQASAAFDWVSQFSWQASATMVEEAIQERLGEAAEAKPAKPSSATGSGAENALKASVVIPTLNAGPVFEDVLKAVLNQRAPWPFEILVIDSGSTDETLSIIKKYAAIRLHQIDKSDFNHGATRNLGAELTSGEFIAFLTHDAMPCDDHWLYNLVTSIERFPDAAGAFGKHLAWPDASKYTKRDLKQHFDSFADLPIAISKDTDKKRWKNKNLRWLQQLHYYSDNNSCFRRDIWEKIPYRPVTFGEDQLWAWDIINAGYEKVYAPQAIVFHSHDYDEQETFERSRIESAFFKHFFNYELMKDEKALHKAIDALNISDADWGLQHGIGKKDIALRQRLNAARLKGYLAGSQSDTSEIF